MKNISLFAMIIFSTSIFAYGIDNTTCSDNGVVLKEREGGGLVSVVPTWEDHGNEGGNGLIFHNGSGGGNGFTSRNDGSGVSGFVTPMVLSIDKDRAGNG